ncbi:hypothetical protein HYDPIDRAFT_33097 [Hydnomerulius pinastri MD-312]|uniref:Uncharacterized protein n=1 Tax=Hydnomerulius pinastri MD-312 TaxID=994086 RepID=A0A0C9V2T2_9AGAM|nr:hypothetical protein HYDPIDRAFT_33097 [Hydnomerulius pinastri MD-312]
MSHLYQQDPMANTPDAHHVIGQSQNFPENLFTFLGQNSDDPAVKDFIPKLKAHLLPYIRAIHIEKQDSGQPPAPSVHDNHSPTSLNQVILKNDRIYCHNLLHINYTTYDVRRVQDTVNPCTGHCDC